MADDYNINPFTAVDIEKYHRGQLSAKEMHAMEKAALDDPFLADALEGYAVKGVDVSADIAELKKRLAAKTEETKVIPIQGGGSSSFPWLRIAVMVILLAGAGLLSWQFLFNTKSSEIAALKPKEESVVKSNEPGTSKTVPGIADSASGVSLPATNLSNPTINMETNNGTVGLRAMRDSKQSMEKISTVSNDTLTVAFIETSNSAAATTASAKTEEKIVAESKAPLNNNGDFKSLPPAKADDAKSKELAITQKPAGVYDADASDVAERTDKNAAARKSAASTNPQGVFRQNTAPNIFRGRITDAHNNALPFANVTNTSDNVGTYTDAKGNFALISADSVLDVQVKSLGFENNRTRLRSGINNNQVVLQEDRSLTAKILDTVKRNYARARDGNLTLEEPEPEDGWNSYDSYLANNLNVPESFDVKKNQGGGDMVELSFEVNRNGDPINIKVEKSLCEKCDKEAIRLIKEGPKWKRKSKKGKRTTVKVPFIKPADW